MTNAFLEHVNITVSDPDKTAMLLCEVFGWRIRWQGGAISDGKSIHVGEEKSYIAIYTPNSALSPANNTYTNQAGLNHIGIVVDDIDDIEQRVINAGYKPHNHGDYEPGKRFYFRDENEVEFEVISY